MQTLFTYGMETKHNVKLTMTCYRYLDDRAILYCRAWSSLSARPLPARAIASFFLTCGRVEGCWNVSFRHL
jgi:hypothetical protein